MVATTFFSKGYIFLIINFSEIIFIIKLGTASISILCIPTSWCCSRRCFSIGLLSICSLFSRYPTFFSFEPYFFHASSVHTSHFHDFLLLVNLFTSFSLTLLPIDLLFFSSLFLFFILHSFHFYVSKHPPYSGCFMLFRLSLPFSQGRSHNIEADSRCLL